MSKKIKIHELADTLGHVLLKHKWRCAVAESCTGGSLSAVITDIAGSSQWFDRGFVSYSNEAKIELLGVPSSVISEKGAVSEATVRAMAEGAISASMAHVSVSISGIAGPSGGGFKKPVGTVWVAWAGALQPTEAQCYFFKGDRAAIREQAVRVALEGLIQRCDVRMPKLTVERYFFALWPNDKTIQAINKCSSQLHEMYRGKAVLPENLHMTLVYLGRVTPDFLKRMQQMAGKAQMASFAIRLSEIRYWSRNHVCCLGLLETPQALGQLVAHLGHRLIKEGFKPERALFIPHVTIARQCAEYTVTGSVDPISWSVQDFCLVKSTGTSSGSKYDIIQRWSLN